MSRHANIVTLWGYILQDETIEPFDESSDSSTWDFDNLSYLAWSAEDAHGVTVQPTGHTDRPTHVVALTRSIVRGGDWSPVIVPRRPRSASRGALRGWYAHRPGGDPCRPRDEDHRAPTRTATRPARKKSIRCG